MKKILVLLTTSIILISGCSTTETPTPTATKLPTTTPTITTTEPIVTTPATTKPATVKPLALREIEIETGNFFFKPNTLTLKVNQPVKINFTNKGTHNFSIKELGVNTDLKGAIGSVTFTPTKTGTFQYFCAVGSHQAMGQVGTVTVTE